MDDFMDKLAEKINAQEMIRANTSAEVEELGRVKGQIDALKETVDQVQGIAGQVQGSAERMQGTVDEFREVSVGVKSAADQVQSASAEARDVVEQMRSVANDVQSMLTEIKNCQREVTEGEGAQDPVAEKTIEKPVLDEDILFIIEEEVSQLGKDFATWKDSFQDTAGVSAEESSCPEVTFDESKLDDLQKAVAGTGEKLDNVQNAIADSSARLSDIQNVISDRGEKLSDLQNAIADSSARLSDIQNVISDRGEKLSDLQNAISDNGEKLDNVQNAIADSSEKLSDLQNAVAGVHEAVTGLKGNGEEESLKELRAEISRLDEHLTNVSASSATKSAESTENIKRFVQEQLEKLKEGQKEEDAPDQGLEEIKALLEELKTLPDEKTKELAEKMTGVHEGLREGYHKECVKVYRNVQAAFIEENQKQTAQLEEKVGKLAGGSKMAMIFSILAFAMGLASVVLQVLNLLKIF